MAELVLFLSSSISSNGEGRFSAEALRLVEGIERKRPSSSAVTPLHVASARIFVCGWITLGTLLQWRRFKVFAFNAKAWKCWPGSWRVSVSRLGGVPCQSSFLGEGEADGGKTEDLGMSWEASSGSVEQSGL